MIEFLLNTWPFMARIGIPLALLLGTGLLLECIYARRLLQKCDGLEADQEPVSAELKYDEPTEQ